MRVGALQDWPELPITWMTPLVIEVVKELSSNIRFGDFPPNSWDTLFTLVAEAFATATPPLVEPVNDIISISLWEDIASPTTFPKPLTKLNIPGGIWDSCIISAIIIAERGAISLGFRTTVQPAANAGANFDTIWFIGQFQGVINPQTPIGSSRTI